MTRKAFWVLLAVLGLTLASAPAASAYQPVNIVHSERIQAGPYGMTVGFSAWPLRAMQSLDFTFIPDNGIDGMSGTVAKIAPGGQRTIQPLARHPRKRDVWGWDVKSMRSEGNWTLRFQLNGPLGPGTGELRNLNVAPQPGPPMLLSWSISVLPLIALVAFLVVAWRRTRPDVLSITHELR